MAGHGPARALNPGYLAGARAIQNGGGCGAGGAFGWHGHGAGGTPKRGVLGRCQPMERGRYGLAPRVAAGQRLDGLTA